MDHKVQEYIHLRQLSNGTQLWNVVYDVLKGQTQVQQIQQYLTDHNVGQYNWRNMQAQKIMQMAIDIKKGKNVDNQQHRCNSQYHQKQIFNQQVKQDQQLGNLVKQQYNKDVKVYQDRASQLQVTDINHCLIHNSSKDGNIDSQLQGRYTVWKMRVQNKLQKMYNYYRREMFLCRETFQSKSIHAEIMNLQVFLKYYKDLELKKAYPVSTATELFKKQAVNRIWLHLQGFKQVHYNLEGLDSQKTLQNQIVKLKNIYTLLKHKQSKRSATNSSAQSLQTVITHTGKCKQDIILQILERSVKRKQKYQMHKNSMIHQRYCKMPQIKEYPTKNRINKMTSQNKYRKVLHLSHQKVSSVSKLPKILKSNNYSQLAKNVLIKNMNLMPQDVNFIQMMGLGQNQQPYLDQYLNKEKLKSKIKKKRVKTEHIGIDLNAGPQMRFS